MTERSSVPLLRRRVRASAGLEEPVRKGAAMKGAMMEPTEHAALNAPITTAAFFFHSVMSSVRHTETQSQIH